MKTIIFVSLLLCVLFLSFESTAQTSERETVPPKESSATDPNSELASVEVEWTGNKRVNIVIDGSSYTFRAGQMRVLQLRSGSILGLNIVRPGQMLSANEILLIDPSGGNLVITIQDDNAVFTYTTPADTEQIIREIFLNMIAVQGGTFSMGFNSDQGEEYQYDEKPVHQVTLSDFSIGKYEVTQAQWRAVMGTNPSYYKNCDTCPVEGISWIEVQTFLSKLNVLTGKNYRLPTEAEWEYAARGGNKSKGYKYCGSNALGTVGWYLDNSGEKTHPVGQKAPNELGIYDMTGNVLEWCQDWYGDYRNRSQSNPSGASSGFSRVIRGGCWYYTASNMRVSNRGGNSPRGRYSDVGFRLAL